MGMEVVVPKVFVEALRVIADGGALRRTVASSVGGVGYLDGGVGARGRSGEGADGVG